MKATEHAVELAKRPEGVTASQLQKERGSQRLGPMVRAIKAAVMSGSIKQSSETESGEPIYTFVPEIDKKKEEAAPPTPKTLEGGADDADGDTDVESEVESDVEEVPVADITGGVDYAFSVDPGLVSTPSASPSQQAIQKALVKNNEALARLGMKTMFADAKTEDEKVIAETAYKRIFGDPTALPVFGSVRPVQDNVDWSEELHKAASDGRAAASLFVTEHKRDRVSIDEAALPLLFKQELAYLRAKVKFLKTRLKTLGVFIE